ncbi:hypothetical protein VOLCADRAFT_86791 [Volvox carteri f. nagariensis]|uniref:Uncharacterized protein n=1 Tax=Volvox carteri f. nagariensis TaxID=3068 RepID=D8TJL7_VOLCA|nr:uncharacterized protein VOLCADRAFT_86791 [Volvox carteri f. nagariensis]EFJ52565.1 hypothetical protein VOLCADRAFT_86791 [Volvox carteri f. nagariensis]|eukprot:XP_002946638.1 hypothetical protein VOLCADRAFT_86791 [Volvox carteri f. nagariensis]
MTEPSDATQSFRDVQMGTRGHPGQPITAGAQLGAGPAVFDALKLNDVGAACAAEQMASAAPWLEAALGYKTPDGVQQLTIQGVSYQKFQAGGLHSAAVGTSP